MNSDVHVGQGLCTSWPPLGPATLGTPGTAPCERVEMGLPASPSGGGRAPHSSPVAVRCWAAMTTTSEFQSLRSARFPMAPGVLLAGAVSRGAADALNAVTGGVREDGMPPADDRHADR